MIRVGLNYLLALYFKEMGIGSKVAEEKLFQDLKKMLHAAIEDNHMIDCTLKADNRRIPEAEIILRNWISDKIIKLDERKDAYLFETGNTDALSRIIDYYDNCETEHKNLKIKLLELAKKSEIEAIV